MRVSKVQDRLFEVIASRTVDADAIQGNLQFLEGVGILAFGDQTSRILQPSFEAAGHVIELTDLCFEDDKSIGLEMPTTWYLNRGIHALSISMYFNFLNYKEMAKAGVLYSRNASAANAYGRIAAIEIYVESDLRAALSDLGSRYFGTPRTLTECMRVLEGWDVGQIPRLRHYLTYAEFIRLWCSVNFPRYKPDEWKMGKERSKRLFQERSTTNVREGIRYFWEHHLVQKPEKISPEDVEVDIVDARFQNFRQPRYVLIGEDVFADERADTGADLIFRSFSESQVIRCPRNMRTAKTDEHQHITARLLMERFPDATVIMYKNPTQTPTFTLTKLDEVKEGISREVAVIAAGLCQVHQILEGGDARR